jgi:hypothetical protein
MEVLLGNEIWSGLLFESSHTVATLPSSTLPGVPSPPGFVAVAPVVGTSKPSLKNLIFAICVPSADEERSSTGEKRKQLKSHGATERCSFVSQSVNTWPRTACLTHPAFPVQSSVVTM